MPHCESESGRLPAADAALVKATTGVGVNMLLKDKFMVKKNHKIPKEIERKDS